jgi:ABC-type lipoprotein export system ATPase subunit
VKTENIVFARNLSRTFFMGGHPVKAIDGIDLEIEEGAFVVLNGRSGSGKSTLLSLVGGLDRPTAGVLLVGGTDLAKLKSAELARFRKRQVGFVFQHFNLLPTLSVLENVALPALLDRQDPHEVYDKARRFLGLVQLEHRAHHKPSEISGGEMQRTAIARALINDPALILADEPTGNLDTKTGERILEFIHDLSAHQGRTVLLATHSSDVNAMASKVLHLKDGKLV